MSAEVRALRTIVLTLIVMLLIAIGAIVQLSVMYEKQADTLSNCTTGKQLTSAP